MFATSWDSNVSDRTLDQQTDEFLLWYRYPHNANFGHGKRHVVHGHTPNPHGPETLPCRSNLDTHAWKTGRLVIAAFDDDVPGPATEYIEVFRPRRVLQVMPEADRNDMARNESNSSVLAEVEFPIEDDKDVFHELDLQQKIDLRWTLRDIKAKRWMLSPVNPLHLEKLIALNLVEMRNDHPALTNAGLDAIP
jgi:hypothetical protein